MPWLNTKELPPDILVNMREISEMTGLAYSTIRVFACGAQIYNGVMFPPPTIRVVNRPMWDVYIIREWMTKTGLAKYDDSHR